MNGVINTNLVYIFSIYYNIYFLKSLLRNVNVNFKKSNCNLFSVYPDSIFKPIFLLNFKEGKMDIREVYENMDKKHALVVALLALIAIATTFSAFQTYKLTQFLSGGAPSAPSAESWPWTACAAAPSRAT